MKPLKGGDQASFDAFAQGKTSSVTFQTVLAGSNQQVTVTITRP